MTFIMTVYANEGIVMASDSRLTVSRVLDNASNSAPAAPEATTPEATTPEATTPDPNATPAPAKDPVEIRLDVVQSDANYKTFLAPNNIGISTCGDASIGGVPLAGYIEAFINE